MDTRLVLHTFLALLLLLIPAGALYMLERSKLVKFVAVIVRMVVAGALPSGVGDFQG